jgi:large-conductance mechanosensitive channel
MSYFQKASQILNLQVLANVVTYNMLNCVIEDCVMPLLEVIVPSTFLKQYNIIIKKTDDDEVHIHVSTVIKKIIFWGFMIFFLVFLFEELTPKPPSVAI